MKILPGTLLLTATLFLGGCGLFNGNAHKNPIRREIGRDTVALEREQYRRHNRKFVCLVVVRDGASVHYDENTGDWVGAEIEIVRKRAQKLQLDVEFVKTEQFAVAAALRNGRGDVAIGKFTEAEIQAMRMRACAPYTLAKPVETNPTKDAKNAPAQPAAAPTEAQKYYFVVRRADASWADALSE